MENFIDRGATSTLNLLPGVAIRHDKELAAYRTYSGRSSSDDGQDAPCPYFDQFHEQDGNEKILIMMNFEHLKFKILYQLLEKFFKQDYNFGRGKRDTFTARMYYSRFRQFSIIVDKGRIGPII